MIKQEWEVSRQFQGDKSDPRHANEVLLYTFCLIDASGSMSCSAGNTGKTKTEVVLQALKEQIFDGLLEPKDMATVAFFGSEYRTPRTHRVLKANLKFEDVEKEAKVDLGGTRLYDSVLDALTTMEREAAGASGKTILYNLICFTDGQDSTGNGLERMVDRLLQPQLDNFQFTAIIVGSEGDMAQGKKILDLMNARWNPKCVTKMNVIADKEDIKEAFVEVKELVQQQRDEVEEAQCPVLCTDEVPLNSSEFAAQVQADWSGEQLEIVGACTLAAARGLPHASQEEKKALKPQRSGDMLEMILADTPLARLTAQALQAQKAQSNWEVLRARQDTLALCKVYLTSCRAQGGKDYDPLAMSDALYKLAIAYSDMECIIQAMEHCGRALASLPTNEPAWPATKALRRDITLLQGEICMLHGDAARAQEAMRYFLEAEGVSSPYSFRDFTAKVLYWQSSACLGIAKLKEAQATRAVIIKLREEASMREGLASAIKGKNKKELYHKRQEEANIEALVECEAEDNLIQKALEHLTGSMEQLYEAMDAEKERLAEKGECDNVNEHAIVVLLRKQLAHIGLRLASTYSLIGGKGRQDQIRRLDEIMQNYHDYERCVNSLPLPIVAKTLHKLGTVYYQAKFYDKSHEAYDELIALQEDLGFGKPKQLAVSKAECFQLKGVVYAAQEQHNRSREAFMQARGLLKQFYNSEDARIVALDKQLAAM